MGNIFAKNIKMCSRVSKLQRTKGGTFFQDALYMVPWAHPRPQPKRHLISIITAHEKGGFCTAHDRDRQTDHTTDCKNRLHLHSQY